MSEPAKKGGRWVFVLAVLAALGFGARVALAQDGLMTCPPPAIGTCTSTQDCQNQCDDLYPPDGTTVGQCSIGNCCTCLL
jgi:hypothetical protein